MEEGDNSKSMSVKRKIEPRMSLVAGIRDHESKEIAARDDDRNQDTPPEPRMSLVTGIRDHENKEITARDDDRYQDTPPKPDHIASKAGISNKKASDDQNQIPKEGEKRSTKHTNKDSEEGKNSFTIFEVPANIREHNIRAYEPQVVSVGPYHLKNPNLARQYSKMTDYKFRCMTYLIARRVRRNDKNVYFLLYNKCLETMQSLENKVRNCYFNKYKLPTEGILSYLMLLDGCFILNLLLKQVVRTNPKPNQTRKAEGKGNDNDSNIEEPVLGMMWIWNMVEYDLLKLENQIPFFVLDALFELLRTPEYDEDVNLVEQALELFSNLRPTKAVTFKPPRDGSKYLHLLHLFHSSLLIDVGTQLRTVDEENPVQPEWIPNATELDRSGVKFRNKTNATGFLDITFENGVMQVPRLEAYDYTETLLRNLIAFEQCYPKTKMQITTYALFMDCIVDRAEDVSLLELKGIIVNRLGAGEAVANLFNSLCKDVHYSLDNNYLRDLFIEVTQYHGSKWHNYRARLMRDYFSNPWAIISLVAAAILLLLTMEQAFFAAYSYFKPAQK